MASASARCVRARVCIFDWPHCQCFRINLATSSHITSNIPHRRFFSRLVALWRWCVVCIALSDAKHTVCSSIGKELFEAHPHEQSRVTKTIAKERQKWGTPMKQHHQLRYQFDCILESTHTITHEIHSRATQMHINVNLPDVFKMNLILLLVIFVKNRSVYAGSVRRISKFHRIIWIYCIYRTTLISAGWFSTKREYRDTL